MGYMFCGTYTTGTYTFPPERQPAAQSAGYPRHAKARACAGADRHPAERPYHHRRARVLQLCGQALACQPHAFARDDRRG